MHAVVEHLLEIGHTRIGMLGDKRAVLNGRLRVDAVAERLSGAGLSLADELLEWSGPDEVEARAAFLRIMFRSAPPTAVVCGNDDLALAALAAASEAGLSVPGDVAVTGFDGADVTAHPLISLTTVRSSWRRMGKYAADLIMAEIEGRTTQPVLVPTELIARRSTVSTWGTCSQAGLNAAWGARSGLLQSASARSGGGVTKAENHSESARNLLGSNAPPLTASDTAIVPGGRRSFAASATTAAA